MDIETSAADINKSDKVMHVTSDVPSSAGNILISSTNSATVDALSAARSDIVGESKAAISDLNTPRTDQSDITPDSHSSTQADAIVTNTKPTNYSDVTDSEYVNQLDVTDADSKLTIQSGDAVINQNDADKSEMAIDSNVGQSYVAGIDSNSDQSNAVAHPVDQSDDCILMEYRKPGDVGGKEGTSDSSSSSTSSPEDSSDEQHDTVDTKINKAISHDRDASPESNRRVKMNRHGFEDIRTKGELLPEELPPLEELCITVDESVEMVAIGTIKSVIGVLVVIQSNANTDPLDDDTILFVEGHKVLGQVFEVFGPVTTPWYSVRFNEAENIAAKDLKVGMTVYCAPREESFTKYVFVKSLKQIRGSDASWEDNNEPPEKFIDFSDDEAERRSKSKKKNKRRRNREPDEKDESEDRNRKESTNDSRRQFPSRDEQNGPRPNLPARGNRNPFHGPDNAGNRPRFPGGHVDRFASPGPNWNGRNRGSQNDSDWRNNDQQQTFSGRPPTNFGGPPQFNAPRFNQGNQRQQRPPEAFRNFGNSNGNFARMQQFDTFRPRTQSNAMGSSNPPAQGHRNQPFTHVAPPPPVNKFSRPPPPVFSQPPPQIPPATNNGCGQMIPPPLIGGNINSLNPPPVASGQGGVTNNNNSGCSSCGCKAQAAQTIPPNPQHQAAHVHNTQQGFPNQVSSANQQPFSNTNMEHEPMPDFIGGPPSNQPPPLMSQRIRPPSNNMGIDQSNSAHTYNNNNQPQASNNQFKNTPPWAKNKSNSESGFGSRNTQNINTWAQPETATQNSYNNGMNSQTVLTQQTPQNLNSNGPNIHNEPPWRKSLQQTNVSAPNQPASSFDDNRFPHNNTAAGMNANMSIVDRRFIQNNE